MSIPKHNELRIPVLNYLSSFGPNGSKSMEQPLAKLLGLSDQEVNQMYESGNGPVFKDRISWALTYLGLAGLVERPKRGVYQITTKGQELLKTPGEIDAYIANKIESRELKKSKNDESVSISNLSRLTPQEDLYESYRNIKKTICDEIIDTILSKSPFEFEKVVVLLLNKMGYGGKIKDSGFVTQSTNDKGIDGIIKEDELGLGKIHIQAKRYKRDKLIGREDIHKFVGALMGAQSNKGVFITTSGFNKNAIDYVKTLNVTTSVVLIDGEKLATYIYDFGVGMQTEQTIEIKRLDSDYWDSMQDRID